MQDAQEPQPPLSVAVADSHVAVDPDGPWLPSRSVVSYDSGAGAIAADAPTLARWGYLLYGVHIVDAKLVTQMTADPEGGEYGLGTVVNDDNGSLVVGHGGNIGSYHGELFVWPDQAKAIVVLVPAPAGAFDVTVDRLMGQLSQATTEP